METHALARGCSVLSVGRERTERRKAMETRYVPLQLLSAVSCRERTERRKAMETPACGCQ